MAHESLKLTDVVTGPSDISRLERELEALDNSLLQLKLRGSGTTVKLPKTSRVLDQLSDLNKINLLEEAERQQLLKALKSLREKAPVLHISFGTEPSAAFMAKLIAWLRQNIHPLLLVSIGLQPAIGVGCTLRTTNRYFDFSLRQNFSQKYDLLIEQLRVAAPPPEVSKVATQ